MAGLYKSAVMGALAMMVGVGSVPAAAQMVSAANPESLASAMRNRGYKAELAKGSDGDPLIRSVAEGANFTILFFGCTNGRACQTVQFYAGFKANGSVPIARMNEWNRTKRFSRVYIDNEGDPVIELDLDLDDGGMSRALFEDNLEFWVAVLPAFRSFVAGE